MLSRGARCTCNAGRHNSKNSKLGYGFSTLLRVAKGHGDRSSPAERNRMQNSGVQAKTNKTGSPYDRLG